MSGALQERLPVSESPWLQARKRFMQTRMGPAGLAILIGIFLFVIIGSLLLPFDFYKVPQPDEINFIGRPPAWGRPFGETGMLQLDVMTLVANGGRTSLTIGFATAIGSITIGTLVGVIAGFIGGKVDGAKEVPKLQKPAGEWNEWRVLVVGDKEIDVGGAAPRWRDGRQEPATSWEALAASLAAKVAARSAL